MSNGSDPQVMRCAEIKRVLSDIFLFKNLNEVHLFGALRPALEMMGKYSYHICVNMCQ